MKTKLDLRPKLLDVRDQGSRPTCLAFAASDAHGYYHRLKEFLSSEYLYQRAGSKIKQWEPDDGVDLDAVCKTLSIDGQPLEIDCPYQNVRPEEIVAAPVLSGEKLFKCFAYSKNKAPTAAQIYEMDFDSHPLVLGVEITRKFIHATGSACIVDRDGSEAVGSHALFLVGAAEMVPGKKLFLVRNSWGREWGDGGHVWLTEAYVDEHMLGTLEIRKAG